ncbi:M48 family metalloprotease [Bacillus thuringiensis]|uniref:M48 family metalloprotease n=1 Tax=Bacillus thuringiensis TaxID=1428 RepID=UPI003999D50A
MIYVKEQVYKIWFLCVADEPFPNAYALGSKTVCVTKGLLKTANEEELAGILAHDLAI